jgi:hypothetical protein
MSQTPVPVPVQVPPAKPTRAQLRSKIFSEQRKSQFVTLSDGLQVEVRQTTVGQMLDTIAIEDQKERMVRLMISSCFVPETDEHLFEVGDLDAVMEMPSGGYYQKLLDAINKDAIDKQAEKAKKSSGEVAPVTSST